MKFVLVGTGVVGATLAAKLANQGHKVSLVGNDSGKSANSSYDLKKIERFIGSGASPTVLVEAGIESADYLIAVADDDEMNVAACFISRLITPKPKRIARVRNYDLFVPEIPSDFLSEYFDLIINPEKAAADQLLRTMQLPGAHELLEFGDGKIRVLGLSIEPNSPLSNMKLSALQDWPEQLPILIVAVMRGSKLVIPSGNEKLTAGDIVYAVSYPEKTSLLFELVGKKIQPFKKVLISVNDRFALTLYKGLRDRLESITFVVSEPGFREELIKNGLKAKILIGDVKDQLFLNDLSMKDFDAFIAATSDDENNVLTALLAKRLGAKSAGCFTSSSGYGSLVSAIGLDVAINLRLAAATEIFQHIHHESVVKEMSLQNEGAGFVEVELNQDSDLLGKKLKDLRLPKGIIITAIERGDKMIIPRGEDVILSNDKVLIFLMRSLQPELERILGFQLELFV
jgi:trk system potassium uptake protein TrkA